MNLSDLRHDFGKRQILYKKIPDSPVSLFRGWLEEAERGGVKEFNAMVLSTVGKEGKPTSRIVLLKELSDTGVMVFYTNYNSRKGKDLAENPNGAIHFFWPEFERQIRIEGQIKKTNSKKSDDYFYTRPTESRVSAIASPQSKTIDNLLKIKDECAYLLRNPSKIRRPESWGGYEITPEYFEFWQGGKNRLHDRLRYQLKEGRWTQDILAP